MDDIPCKRLKVEGAMDVMKPDVDGPYFRSYADINIHEEMIADTKRTMAYRQAILRNYESIRGKVVIDVGAGTGILSMFCVQAGARKVYAIEASAIAEECCKVVRENDMEDRITVVQGRVEDVEVPEKADVIVSEWMGYFLFYETMLPSVLCARDKWLKQDGIMLPSSATLYIAPFTDPDVFEDKTEFWSQVEVKYKVKMAPLAELSRRGLTEHVHVHTVPGENIVAHAAQVCHLVLKSVIINDLSNIQGDFKFSCFGHSTVHGLVTWFQVEFPRDVTLSTSPYEKATHWEQSIVYFQDPLNIQQDSFISGSISLKPNKQNSRYLDISITHALDGEGTVMKTYCMDDYIT